MSFWSPGRNDWFPDIAVATGTDLVYAKARFDHEMNHMARRVWDREMVPPLYALDRPVLPQAGKPPSCRLVMIYKRITRKDRPEDLYFDAQHLRWKGSGWAVMDQTVITGPVRIGYIWPELPPYREWRETRQRIRLAAQLGTYIQAELPEGYR